jgi:hypothetical protein
MTSVIIAAEDQYYVTKGYNSYRKVQNIGVELVLDND